MPKFLESLSADQQGYLYTAITMLIWGGFSIIARLNAYWQIPVWDVLALRFMLAAAIILPILCYRRELNFLKDKRLLIMALTGSVGYCILVYTGFYLSPVVHGIILLNGSFPLFSALIAFLLLGERIDRQSMAGFIIILFTLIGMVMVMLQDDIGFGVGEVAFIGSAICWGGFSALLRVWKFSAWQIVCGIAIWSAVIYLPLYAAAVASGIITPKFAEIPVYQLSVQAVFHGILVVIVATLTYTKAVEKIGLFKASSIATLAPFAAAVLAVPLLGEPLSLIMVFGLIGMALGALQPWRWFGKS